MRGEVGQADAGGVAVRLGGQAANVDQPHGRHALRRRLRAEGAFAADHVGIHAGAADVLADLIHDQQIGLAQRQPASRRRASVSSCSSRVSNVLRSDALNDRRLVVGILDQGQSEGDGGGGSAASGRSSEPPDRKG